MPTLTLILPGSLDTRTGGYGYDRCIVDGLRARGWTVTVEELDDSFPCPTPLALAQAGRVLAAVPDGRAVLVDGLALGAMAELVDDHAGRLDLVALVHHPLAAETGIDPSLAARLEAGERRALAAVRRVVVTSRATAVALDAYNVGPERVDVVEPGTDRAPLAKGSASTVTHLLCVGTLIPRKGHDVLFRALATVPHAGWRLTCVGSLERDRATVASLRADLRRLGLEDRVTLVGEAGPTALADYYDSADLFVLPTYYEGYGMAVAEALTRGLPVVSTATGAIAELVATHGAGVLVPAGDAEALAAALTRVLGDPQVREDLARGARVAREVLPSWDDAAERMARILNGEGTDGRLQR